ncbi:leucine zipper putative tumor suppressor 2 homolog [Mya arenaria]|uniref:leucine zipper putative tumor suppressor 2 homolog n=1 Tax=Mya arenaria TaxID=6604 RepID=UPI0022E0739D|nr:leucine zipper putative tumor suppressor 2 homolog [Mya arenaria]XP_052772529.1 leucine zipper putative tumor suppressor 2 homolog [Mya arenaria]XP_052772530.1 leucine zipper putative tumor suppressor 2 homolog [Mya arenaria]XP_052772531.1 leucine zipper putative tumor suppressor 2 homolog [Mya arenaria]XP_052772532.1 leucine zipper putative tumor suppressor 2 homolog [Mya arenaria]XP_052772533.1 leucine zipper putative tumor suppressor 2 homolog [Mya arenaria]
MTSFSYPTGWEEGSDAVFSEEEFYPPHTFSQNDVFSLNNSTTSLQDGYVYSPRGSVRGEGYSPTVSNYSTYSQEVKYIFDPNFGNSYNNNKMQQRSRSHSNIKMHSTPAQFESMDSNLNFAEDDYSHIQPNRKMPVQRKTSNASQSSYRGQDQGQLKSQGIYSQGHSQGHSHSHSKNPPPPPPRTCSAVSTSQLPQQDDATLTPRKPTLSHSMSASCSSAYYFPQTQVRRKTWSPEGVRVGNFTTASARRGQRLRSYSNEQLLSEPPHPILERPLTQSSADRDHIYEELEAGPPRLAPSGLLNRSPGRGIVKPIAFKPVVPNPKPTSTPKHFNEQVRKYSSHDDGYGSQDYGVTSSHNVSNMSSASHGSAYSHVDFDRSASFSSECIRTSDRADSVAASHMSRLSSNQIEGYIQTPSPSDSGVGELEAILKEKDAEINTLRDVMDKNERAIFQVYDEKRNGWIREIQEIRDEYEGKLKQLQRKQYKSDQVLNLQVFKLQQDKKTMKDEMDKLVAEKDDLAQKCEVFANETNALQAQMDDATWQGRRRSSPSDINGLHNEIDSLRHKLTAKSNEVLQLTGQLSDMKSRLEETSMHFDHHRCRADLSSESLQRMNNSGSDLEPDIPLCHCEKQIQTDLSKALTPERETLKPSLICEKDKEVIALREEVEKLRLDVLVNKEEHDKEKEQWLEEKNKVIMYQKQLQLNYVQMFRKNKVLEAEVEQLTLELESRDMKLMALNGEESVC